MKIPVANLRPQLAQTECDWRAGLAALFARAHFILGEEVAAFEAELARAWGARHGVTVGSGTSAIELSLRAAGLGDSGKHVLTSPLTAPFTGIAILNAGCKPVFADIDADTLLMNVSDAASRITKRTAAIVPVHLYGQPCDMAAVRTLARDARAAVVQDACQAHGADCASVPFTAYSDYVAYSFYPTKNLGCLGDGGAILTNRTSAARLLRLLRDGGRGPNHVSRIRGVNSRLDEIQACFLRAFLPKLQDWNDRRRRIAALYTEALRDCPGVRIVKQRAGSVYHLFVIRARHRERLRRHLAECGIGTAVHYPVPLHLQPAFRDCGLKRGDLPSAEKACREIVSIPIWPGMTDAAALEVAGRIREFY